MTTVHFVNESRNNVMYSSIDVLYVCTPLLDSESKRDVHVATKHDLGQCANPMQCSRPCINAARVVNQSKVGTIRYDTVQRIIAHVCTPSN